MAHQTIRSVSAIGATPVSPPPAAIDGQQLMLTELTRSTVHVNPPLTVLTGSTQSTHQLQQPPPSISTPNLPRKTFAEVVVPSRTSKTTNTATNKYFFADSPPPAIGTVLADDRGLTLLFTDAETEVLAAPFRFALVGKFSHGALSYSMLHKLIAGTGIKNKFMVSMMNNRHVLISLSCEADYTRLWLRRIWYIQKYPMRIFKWTPTFTPSKESSIVPVWVSFPELPAHLFRKARACIELDLLKPRLEDFQIQICGATIVQRIERCSQTTPQKPSNREIKGKKVAKEVGRDKAITKEQVEIETTKAFERGESSRYPTNPSNDDVDSGKHGNDIAEIETSDVSCDSNVENELHVDNANCSAHEPADNLVVGENHVVVHDNIVSVNVANTAGDDGNMGEENSENKIAEENWIQVENATMLLQEGSDKGETLVLMPRL
ncbi:UNVERIFIED_CONTAM: hypothetical protein Sindi_0556100 [Sesamum indicum]